MNVIFESILYNQIPVNSLWWMLKYILLPIFTLRFFLRYKRNSNLKDARLLLQDKVVLITGASSGIGEAMAHSFYSHGCRVILASRRISELNRVKMDLMNTPMNRPCHEPVVMPIDLSEIHALSKHVDKMVKMLGHIDILVNNGGISYRGYTAKTDIEVDMQLMLVNYFGQIALTKAVLKNMIERNSGHIVCMSSMQGKVSLPYRSSYGSSKHALESFCNTLRSEVHKHNVNVTIISPTYVNTSLSMNALTEDGTIYGGTDPRTKGGITAQKVASRTLDAVALAEHDVIIGPFIHLCAIEISKLFPKLFFKIMLLYEKTSIPKPK